MQYRFQVRYFQVKSMNEKVLHIVEYDRLASGWKSMRILSARQKACAESWSPWTACLVNCAQARPNPRSPIYSARVPSPFRKQPGFQLYVQALSVGASLHAGTFAARLLPGQCRKVKKLRSEQGRRRSDQDGR